LSKKKQDILQKKILKELVAIRTAIGKMAETGSSAQSSRLGKDYFLQENVAASSTTSQIASVIMAALVFLLSIPSLTSVQKPYYDILISLVSIAEISFVTAITYFMRGSNPEHCDDDLKVFNRKGDLFLAIGWIWLFIVPVFLVVVQRMIAASILGVTSLVIAVYALYKDGIYGYALKLIVYTAYYRDFRHASTRARSEGKTTTDSVLLLIFYVVLALALVLTSLTL
jgi:hypothetical protein